MKKIILLLCAFTLVSHTQAMVRRGARLGRTIGRTLQSPMRSIRTVGVSGSIAEINRRHEEQRQNLRELYNFEAISNAIMQQRLLNDVEELEFSSYLEAIRNLEKQRINALEEILMGTEALQAINDTAKREREIVWAEYNMDEISQAIIDGYKLTDEEEETYKKHREAVEEIEKNRTRAIKLLAETL